MAARSLAAAEKFAKLHGIPKAYGSYEELAQDNNVQVVYIGAINTQHLPVGKLMLEHGKHLLVEKPLTLNLKCTEELLALAASKKLFLMEAIWSRFLPSYRFLAKKLEEKAIGDIYHVSVNFGIPIAEVERVAKKELGGGTILDIGVYAINLILVALEGIAPLKIQATGHLNASGKLTRCRLLDLFCVLFFNFLFVVRRCRRKRLCRAPVSERRHCSLDNALESSTSV